MPRTLTDTPAAAVQALNHDGAVLPPRSSCEVFSQPEAKVQCMVCVAPAMKGPELMVVVVLMGADRHEQREAATLLQRLLGEGAKAGVELRLLQSAGVTLMLAPWSARELVRGVARSVSASWHPKRITVDATQLGDSGVVVVPGPGSHGDMAVEIRQALDGFVADTDSLWTHARRLLSKRTEPKHWSLPLGCSVTERQVGRQLCWDIGFEDVRRLERAAQLVDVRLAMGRDGLKRTWAPLDEDAVETRLPSISLMAQAPSRAARAQLARLLRNVLFQIGRLGFAASRPAELSDPLGHAS
jgi:hypothetical protein